MSALLAASMKGHGQVVQQLINAGADVNARNQNGVSGTEYALAAGHQEVANILRKQILKEQIRLYCYTHGGKPYQDGQREDL